MVKISQVKQLKNELKNATTLKQVKHIRAVAVKNFLGNYKISDDTRQKFMDIAIECNDIINCNDEFFKLKME